MFLIRIPLKQGSHIKHVAGWEEFLPSKLVKGNLLQHLVIFILQVHAAVGLVIRRVSKDAEK